MGTSKKHLKEKSKSKSQQRLMGMALSVKRGEQKISDLPKSVRDKVKGMQDMSEKELEKYASTKHKKLPEKIEESIDGHYMNTLNIDKIYMYSKWLKNHVPDSAPLYNWMESKLAQAADDIAEVKHKLEHKLRKHGVIQEDSYVDDEGNLKDFDLKNYDRVDKRFLGTIFNLMSKIMSERGFALANVIKQENSHTVFFKRPTVDEEGNKSFDQFIVRYGSFVQGGVGLKIIFKSAKGVGEKETYSIETEDLHEVLEHLYIDFEIDREFTI